MAIANPVTPASIGAVPISRLVSAGNGMSGGGALSANISLASNMALIQRQVLGAPAASVTFSAIPATYEDLILEIVARGTAAAVAASMFLQFNGDTGANYDFQYLLGINSVAQAAAAVAQNFIFTGFITAASATLANNFSNCQITIPAYLRAIQKGTNAQNSHIPTGSAADNRVLSFAGNWRNTAAIASLALTLSSGNYDTGSVFSLYGRS